jgi:hypothetical protein
MDGYPYSLMVDKIPKWPETALGVDGNIMNGAPNWTRKKWASCHVLRSQCFPEGSTATEIFHNLMFTHPEACGDCGKVIAYTYVLNTKIPSVIKALVARSGRLGLEAFLPPPHRIHYSNTKGRVVQDVDPESAPRLPLMKRPHDASFALNDVLRSWGTVRMRDWILRAMERYRFIIGMFSLCFSFRMDADLCAGDTPAHFAMLSGPKSAHRAFQVINSRPEVALLAINDDVVMEAEQVDKMFRSFLDRRWGFPSAWEDAYPKEDVSL